MNTSLAFFYENIQISEKDVEQISDDSCCKITLQNKNNLEIILSQTLILSQINEPPIAKPWNPSDFSLKLQFLGCESKNIGSITLPFELFFLSDNPKRISQWFYK